MSNYLLLGTGAAVTGGSNANLFPLLPASAVSGNLLLLACGTFFGSPAGPPTVSGWTQISPNTNTQALSLFARIATGSGDAPTMNYGYAGTTAFAYIVAYSGNPPSLTGPSIVHASSDNQQSNPSQVNYNALTITAPSCLVLSIGSKNKVAASNGLVPGALTNFTTELYGNAGSGTTIAWVFNDWLQGSATSLTSQVQTFAPGDGASETHASIVIALLPAPPPPPSGNASGPMPKQLYIMP